MFKNKILVHMKTFDLTIDHILIHFIDSKLGLYFSFRIPLQLAKKWPEMVVKQTFISCYFFASQPSQEMEIFAFCVITFEPIKIQTNSAHQNDRLNLSFVKDKHAVGKNMARNSHKPAICFVIFVSKQSLSLFIKDTFFESLLSIIMSAML